MNSKTIATILACSAVGLAGAIAYSSRSTLAVPSVGTSGAEPEIPVTGGTSGSGRKVPITVAKASGSTRSFTWQQVESEEYKNYIANLRGIGCPEQTIRDVIIADVNKLYAAREKPLKGSAPVDTGTDVPTDELERRRQLREIQLEKRAVIKELLGIDLPLDLLPSTGSRNYDAFEIGFRFLPTAKRDAVQTLQENYWQKSDVLKNAFKDQKNPEYVAQSRQLGDMLREELKKILTTEELEDFDLRTSPAAKKLATQLASTFTPSEDEFRKVFRTTQQREERLARLPPAPTVDRQASPEARELANQQRKALTQERTAINTQLNEQLKTGLGDQRYADYERSQDSAYELFTRLGIRYGLDQATVMEAYNLQKSFKAPEPPPGTDAAARRALATEAAAQMNEKLAGILGEQAARGYRRVRNPDGSTRNVAN